MWTRSSPGAHSASGPLYEKLLISRPCWVVLKSTCKGEGKGEARCRVSLTLQLLILVSSARPFAAGNCNARHGQRSGVPAISTSWARVPYLTVRPGHDVVHGSAIIGVEELLVGV